MPCTLNRGIRVAGVVATTAAIGLAAGRGVGFGAAGTARTGGGTETTVAMCARRFPERCASTPNPRATTTSKMITTGTAHPGPVLAVSATAGGSAGTMAGGKFRRTASCCCWDKLARLSASFSRLIRQPWILPSSSRIARPTMPKLMRLECLTNPARSALSHSAFTSRGTPLL